MRVLKEIFGTLGEILGFINKYFKAMIFLLLVYLIFFTGQSDEIKQANLAEIRLDGAIMDANDVLEKIYASSDNKNIKAVLFNIDSPGGALSPSVEISKAIKELNEKKPVIVYASGTMASGSYLSGVWAHKILANEGSFIGSIGVIMQGANIENLANKIGISEQTVKAGEYKEAGTFMRAWNEKERESLQNLVDKSYGFFVKEVANARHLNIDNNETWANARVFLADDALKLGLIDEISTYKRAKSETEKISGVLNPVWQEEPFYEKMLKRLETSTKSQILGTFTNKILAIN
ncbi:signal peptide peptidase SppA [Campylobacter hominis]|uniref:signal peptide peptidase SppA n=1 Tax=Campylobacter hominis TaxID=76517 RepID=UPI00248C9BDD|nr:signal peptide peptidase SppA [Campylobacter hominis]